MKHGWSKIRLDEACSLFTDGDWIESKDQSPNGIRLIQTGNVGNGQFKDRGEKARYISSATFKRLNCQEIFPGDCLISRLPDPVGRACLVPETGEQMITAVDCTILRFNGKLIPSFFTYYAQSRDYLRAVLCQCTGATRQRISRKNLGQICIPVPPLPEQMRIVATLDEAFAGIDQAVKNTERNLASARELFESELNRVFREGGDWDQVRLADVCAIESRLVDPKESKYLDLPHIGGGNMVSQTGELVSVKTAREEGLISGKYLFDERMVLYSKIRPYLEKVCRPGFDGLCSADVYPLLPVDGTLARDYLYYALLSRPFTTHAIKGSDRAGMPKVNREHLFAYQLSLPDLEMQAQLAQRLDSLSESQSLLRERLREKLALLEELKQSILQKAFAGELTADDADRELAEAGV